MSERKIRKEIPAQPACFRDEVVGHDCDRCGRDIPPERPWENRDFKLEMMKRHYVLEFARGQSFPECGDQKGWEVPDLCDECVDFLRDLLVENGFKIAPIDRTW